MTNTPPDWVLIEAAKRWGYTGYTPRDMYVNHPGFYALCDMIQKHEQPPVDRKLLCAREAVRLGSLKTEFSDWIAVRAIELWEEGFGK